MTSVANTDEATRETITLAVNDALMEWHGDASGTQHVTEYVIAALRAMETVPDKEVDATPASNQEWPTALTVGGYTLFYWQWSALESYEADTMEAVVSYARAGEEAGIMSAHYITGPDGTRYNPDGSPQATP